MYRTWCRGSFLDEIIRVDDQFYVLATSPMIDDRTRVLKHDETFAVFDRYGDIQSVPRTEQGLYDEEPDTCLVWNCRLGTTGRRF
jgi:hypothetical protein